MGPPVVATFQIQPFSTARIMGERVSPPEKQMETKKKCLQEEPFPKLYVDSLLEVSNSKASIQFNATTSNDE